MNPTALKRHLFLIGTRGGGSGGCGEGQRERDCLPGLGGKKI